MKETMSSRQRVLMALNYHEPDRVPLDLGGNQSGIHQLAYRALLNHLGLEEDVTVMDAAQQLAMPSEAVLQRFRIDTRYIHAGPGSNYQPKIVGRRSNGRTWHDLTDEWGVTWSMPDDSPLYMDISYHPLADATVADLRAYPFPKGNDPARFAGMRERAQELLRRTPYAVVSGISGVVYETCWYLRGLERWYMDMVEHPEFCAALIDCTLQYWLDWFDLFLAEVGDCVDVIMIGDDLAGQRGPLFRPSFYSSVIKPRQKRLVQFIKSRTQAKIWYHTCGACSRFIPELLDNGIDILNPVQISAAGMNPADLKAAYGERLTFWGGGIDAQHVLPHATPDSIREHVRHNVEILKPGGGYVFNNVHNIQAGVPPENIVAMYDAAYEAGFY
jgi:uroporphyrinogen decarboxylase